MGFLKGVLLCFLASTLSGCLAVSMKNKWVYDEASRVSVVFESGEASQIFHSKLRLDALKKGNPYVGSTQFGIPFVVFIDHTIIYETAYYNARVREADINGDGVITVEEAKNLSSGVR